MGSEKVSRETASAMGGAAVTASDTAVFDVPSRALWVGTGGTLVVRMAGDGSQLTFTNIANGTLLALAVDKVLATGTTASGIVLLR